MSLFRLLTKKGPKKKAKSAASSSSAAKPGKNEDMLQKSEDTVQKSEAAESKKAPDGSSLDERLGWLRQRFERCADAVFHSFTAAGGRRCALVYLKGLTDQKLFVETVMENLLSADKAESDPYLHGMADGKQMPVSSLTLLTDMDKALGHILDSGILLLMDAEAKMFAFPLSGFEKRSIVEATNEKVVRGPREAFIEDIATNVTLLRRRIKSADMKLEQMQFGTHTKTTVYLVYLEGVCKKELVREIKNRLERIEIDGVLGSSYLEEFLEDNPYSPFPQIQYTERPDIISAALLEGRAAILVDGTPIQLTMPANLFMFLQSPEDYFQRFYQAVWIRWLRYLFTFVSLFLPSVYIAVTTFHPEMLPTNLLYTVAAARDIVPFPALVEAFLMELIFEVFREGALRVPQAIGQTVTVVGGLVIGQAAIQAGVVSAPLLIIVAVTGISSFVIPHFDFGLSLRLLRFPMMFLAGTLGLYGIALGMILLYLHLLSLRSFGMPYLSPLAPLRTSDLKDVAVRAPWWLMSKKPSFSLNKNRRRLDYRQRPMLPGEEGD
jgi:spore germination protein